MSQYNLHSNLFILILLQVLLFLFFHYHLHSNLFILIQAYSEPLHLDLNNLHSNLFILIREKQIFCEFDILIYILIYLY